MQSIFLACYFCLQLIALHSQDQTALQYRDSSCDQCLTGVVEELHLSSDLATQVEDFLSIKKPSSEILSSNPELAEAIAKLVQEQIAPTTENPSDEEQQKPNGFLGKVVDSLVKPKPQGRSFLRINERLMAGESLVSENQKYLATLNNHGDLILTDADGNFIEELGCRSEEPSQDYNMLFHSSNSVRFYKKVEVNSDDYYCSSGIPIGCTQQGVRCYLNLDNDGRLRFYSGDGHFEYYYSNQPEPTTSGNLPENETPEPQQPSGAENPQEIEYKGPSTLKRNQRLKVGESLVSENGKFKITLNRRGQFETFDSYGELIRNSGSCDNSLPSSDTWNVMMHSDNSRRLYRDLDRDANDYACSSGIPWGCTLSGVECYLKLDDDGILKIFDDKGQVEMEFTFNKLDSP